MQAACFTALRLRSVDVDDLDAPVLRPGALVGARRGRTLLAEAHGGDLRSCTPCSISARFTVCDAALAEVDVVLARTALVGVAFEPHAHRGVAGEDSGHAPRSRPRIHCGCRCCRSRSRSRAVQPVRHQVPPRPGASRRPALTVATPPVLAPLPLPALAQGGSSRIARLAFGWAQPANARVAAKRTTEEISVHCCSNARNAGPMLAIITKVQFENGPQTGSRTSPSLDFRRALTWPSTETVASTPWPPSRPA